MASADAGRMRLVVARSGDQSRIRLALARSAHFGKLSPEVLDRLTSMARMRHARHGERLGSSDGRDDQLWIVVSGAVRISTRPQQGSREVVHAVLGSGSFFGLANAVQHGPYTFDARAFGTTDLAVVDGARVQAGLEQYPRLWRRVSGLLAHRLKVALDVIADNRALPLAERLVRRLIGVATSTELLEGAQPTVHMTQGDLARMLDAGRSKINLALKRLETQGVLRTGYRTITLLDMAALRKLAGREVEPF
jgi:CRP/FNR family transcriptional regulator, cyclic AMP receptor protein